VQATRPADTRASTPPAAKPDDPDEPLPPLEYEAELPASVREAMYQRYTGDLDELVKRRLVRVGVTYNRTNYFVDNGVQRGATYEFVKLFEDRLNAGLKTGNLRIHVVCIPLPRNLLLPALNEGRIDIAEGQLTITSERQAIVDFGPSTRTVNEIVVTARGTTPVSTAYDLSGREVFVRKSSSYYESLLALNKRLESSGRPKALILEAPESLEDDDILEMVNAGLVETVVVDDYLARFWKQILPNVTLNTTAVLRSGGRLAAAFRKNSPVMARTIAAFTEKWGPGTRSTT
jgi:membrane-bound lytic murein transglycosylase MltF